MSLVFLVSWCLSALSALGALSAFCALSALCAPNALGTLSALMLLVPKWFIYLSLYLSVSRMSTILKIFESRHLSVLSALWCP